MVFIFVLAGLKSIEIGCAVNEKSFIVDYNIENKSEKEKTKNTNIFTTDEYNAFFQDYYNNRKIKSIEFSYKYNSLVTFFLQLTRYLQQSIGTVAAINLSEYAKAINYEIDEEL